MVCIVLRITGRRTQRRERPHEALPGGVVRPGRDVPVGILRPPGIAELVVEHQDVAGAAGRASIDDLRGTPYAPHGAPVTGLDAPVVVGDGGGALARGAALYVDVDGIDLATGT